MFKKRSVAGAGLVPFELSASADASAEALRTKPAQADLSSRTIAVLAARPWSRWLFITLWLVALLPRLALTTVFWYYPITLSDMLQYDMLARSLSEGRGYRWYTQADIELFRPYLSLFLDLSEIHVPADGLPTTFRAPGYPFFLAGVYSLVSFADRIALARLAQALLMALTAPLAAVLAIEMGLGRRVGALAGLGVALYPILVFYPLGLASENLFIPLVLVSFLTLLKAAKSPHWALAALAGVTLAAAMLTRSILAPFVILAALWMGRFGRAGKKRALLLVLVAFGICLPWAIRNTMVMGRPTFVETSLGYNLFVGYHPAGNGGFVAEVSLAPLAILDDAERDRYSVRLALEFIRADPGQIALRALRRAAYFVGVEDRELLFFYNANFFGYIPQPWLALIYLLVITPWIGTLLYTVFGTLLAPERSACWLLLALIAGYVLPHLLVIAEPRFHLALVPVLMPFAALAWVERRRAIALLRAGHPQSRGKRWLAYASLGTLLALWAWGFALNWSRLLAIMGPGGNQLYLPY